VWSNEKTLPCIDLKGRLMKSLVLLSLVVCLIPAGLFADSPEFSKALDAYFSGDYSTAYSLFHVLAVSGDAGAQCYLGNMSSAGVGVPQDDSEAVKWYRLAAEQGYAPAQYCLGNMSSTGKGVPQDDSEAVKWYRLAAEQGDAAAQLILAVAYDTGKGVPQDDSEAVKWYRLAAEQGIAAAQYRVGAAYYTGKGVPQDFVMAHCWFNLAAAFGDADNRGQFLKARDLVASRMVPAQIADAQRMARDWRPKTWAELSSK
jgi:TPR repeat protein